MRREWEVPEVGTEDALSMLEDLLNKHYEREPARKSGKRWAGWETRRRVLSQALDDLRSLQVLQAISSLQTMERGTIPAAAMELMYDAVLELGHERGLGYFNTKRRELGYKLLVWAEGQLVPEE